MIVRHAEQIPLGVPTMSRMLGKQMKNTTFYQYDELSHFKTMEEAMQGKQSMIILMNIMTNNKMSKIGHWICILDKGSYYEHFDSYGLDIDQELHITHEKKYLSLLLKNSSKGLQLNREKLQERKEDVNTCGRWVVCRTIFYNQSLHEFISVVKSCTPDVSVVLMTLPLLSV